MTCSNNANCVNTLGSYKCKCKAGFIGDGRTCTNVNECESNTYQCRDNSVCVDTIGSYNCSCETGYTLKGQTCQDINECDANQHNCHPNGRCVNTVGSFKCECKSGFIGDGVSLCTDVNECENPSRYRCQAHSYCRNNEGSYICICRGGYVQINNYCHQCSDGNTNHCHKDAKCDKKAFQSYQCKCKPGFEGNGTYCKDINECDRDSCKHGTCKNMPGTYRCLCDSGYRANAGKKMCIDIDECTESNMVLCNGTDQKCVNTPGNYACVSKYIF